MDKVYNHKDVEDKIYALWEKSGYFNPDNLPVKKAKSFCIIMPPPNANGSLHIGHAVFVTLQDIMIRYHRMKGEKTLWLPGADHAGFETQVVYDKKLVKESRNRFQVLREQLYQEILSFTLENKKTMEAQLRKLGASGDWSREKFTLDPDIVKVVYRTFQKLKEDGLIYKGERITNWCTKHQTSLSDLEVNYVEKIDTLYYVRYGPLELATVRPETKFGDTAIAVHPKDKRYEQYIGKEIEIETVLGPARIKVIADSAVDKDFGTGVIKVTPAHDPQDFEIWQRHKCEMPRPISVIDKFGKLNERAGPYQGLKVLEARKKIVEDMIERGLINTEKTDNHYKHNIATCYKCGSVIEPLLLENQWFIKMSSLRDLAVRAVKRKEIIFIPKRFEKIFYHWMKNIKDWNISRQITWGIPIPGDEDGQVFDTWFSSGQWPFATLMTTRKKDFETFYPTDVMETGWDILFFWVARMIMLGLYITGRVPFRTVYLHGLVRDKDRKKMSKSKGNVIDPLGVIELYGADALRMALVVGNTPGSDPVIYEEKIKGYRNFANKVWNIARFYFIKSAEFKAQGARLTLPSKTAALRRQNLIMQHVKSIEKDKTDKLFLKKLEELKKSVTGHIEHFRFYKAAEELYHFIWHEFADKYLENVKKSNDPQKLLTFNFALCTILRLLHPFMPFVTEAVWQELTHDQRPITNDRRKLLMVEKWPE